MLQKQYFRVNLASMLTQEWEELQSRHMRTFLICCLFLAVSVLATAHEKHNQPETTAAEQNPQTPTESSKAEEPGKRLVETKAAPKGVPLPFSGDIRDHAHNKLVHFPLAFGIAGVLFAFITLKKPEMLTAVRILWLLAALGAVGAYFTGEAQEEPFEDDPALHEVVELHENLGIASGIALAIGFFISLTRRLRGLSVAWAVVVLLILSVTGYYGGLLAHH